MSFPGHRAARPSERGSFQRVPTHASQWERPPAVAKHVPSGVGRTNGTFFCAARKAAGREPSSHRHRSTEPASGSRPWARVSKALLLVAWSGKGPSKQSCSHFSGPTWAAWKAENNGREAEHFIALNRRSLTIRGNQRWVRNALNPRDACFCLGCRPTLPRPVNASERRLTGTTHGQASNAPFCDPRGEKNENFSWSENKATQNKTT